MAEVALEQSPVGVKHLGRSRDPDGHQEGAAGQQQRGRRARPWHRHRLAMLKDEHGCHQVGVQLDDARPQRRARVALATATGHGAQGDL